MDNIIREQYRTDENLKARADLHSFQTNKTNWNQWCFSKMQIPKNAVILELGCGMGDFWLENSEPTDKSWSIILSDFSEGMLKSTKDRLLKIKENFQYRCIDAQDIPYKENTFDIVIARHMLYLVPDIEKALSEIRRVLKNDGRFYATTNSSDAMAELNELVKEFDANLGLHNNGMGERFDDKSGERLLKKYFRGVSRDTLEGKIVIDHPEPAVFYKASTIKGKAVFTDEKKRAFTAFLNDYLKEHKKLFITTKAMLFEAIK